MSPSDRVPASPPDLPRVGYVTKVYPRFSETFIVSEVLALEALGLDVEIVSLRPPVEGRFHAALAEVRAPVTYLPAYGLKAVDLWSALCGPLREGIDAETQRLLGEADARDAHQALLLAEWVRERGIEHLHAHFASVAAVVARLAARLAGVTWSVTAHAKDIYLDDVDAGQLRALLTDAAAVVTVSEHNVGHLREVIGAVDARVHRIYNGIDLTAFPYAPGAPESSTPVVVSVGRLVEKKGFEVLIDACALLRDAGRPVACRIVGDGERRDALAARIAERGLGGLVDLVGPLQQERVREEVRAATVFAGPYVVSADGNRDGLPTVLLEAMALGTPCVSTDVTGVPEAVRHDETGLLVGQHDVAATAAAIARLLDDAALRGRLSRAARAHVEEHFDVRRQAAQLLELYREVTGCVLEGVA